MFRLLDRYIIREIAPYFLLAFFLLTAIIFVHEANRFSELFILFSQRGLSSKPLFVLVLSLLPGIVIFTLPISFLVGTLMALGRLSGDSEMLVMRAGGVSPFQVLRPVMMVAVFVMCLTAYDTFYLLPVSVDSLNQLKKTRGQLVVQSITTQIQPGRFAENLPNRVVYIERKDRQTDDWTNIFIAEQAPDAENKEPKIYTAKGGKLVLGDALEDTELRLEKCFVYESEARRPGKQKAYPASFAGSTVIGFDLSGKKKDDDKDDTSDLAPVPIGPDLMTLPQLWNWTPDPTKRTLWRVEINKRFAIPAACLVFAFAGVAFGITSARSGRSSGLVKGLAITLAYYVLFLAGEQNAKSGSIAPVVGVWGPDLLVGALGFWLFAGGPAWVAALPATTRFWTGWNAVTRPIRRAFNVTRQFFTGKEPARAVQARRAGQVPTGIGFRIIDRMILSEATRHLLLVLVGLCAVFVIFTLFSLLNNIVKNNIRAGIVVEYVVFLMPWVVNLMMPFAVLVAVLVTFGLYGKTSQLVAFNSSGQSLYRLSLPVMVGALLVGGMMLGAQEYILPFTNRTQDYLRHLIKGGQPQTFYQGSRKWFYGQDNHIFNFRLFDADKNEFFGLAIYEINPQTAGLASRLYARTARWDGKNHEWILSKGWRRTFTPDGRTLEQVEIREERLKLPETPSYFKQEVPEVSKMNIRQLRDQIVDMERSGLDALTLHIALQSRFAAPLACLVMALVGLPFSFTFGKRGALVGVSVGIAIALLFWGAIGVFDQLGRYELLPPFWAAWGPNLLFSVGGLYLLFTSRT